MSFVVFLIIAVVVLIVFSGGYVFFCACRRRKELPWLDRETMEKTPYGEFFDHIEAGDTWLREHCAKDVWVQSADGLKLHALWVPAVNPKGSIILVHGYRSCYLADFGLVLDMYHNLNLNILIPDQRSHGKSEGKYITFGVKESDDISRWIDYHNKYLGGYPLVLSGLSMGASTVLYLADADLPVNVCGIIADCGFTSPKQIIEEVYRKHTHLWPGPSIFVADLFARVFAGFSLRQKDTRKSLANAKLPVLMVHGGADHFVPCTMSQEGYTVCTAPKQLLIAETAGHGVSYLHIKEKYTAVVINFLKTYVDGFAA